jgi:hypothetical protein
VALYSKSRAIMPNSTQNFMPNNSQSDIFRCSQHAQQMAAQESPRTTKLYDRTKDEITIGEVERIQL